jgi:methyl-accepting chemotaxis protein
MKELLNERLQLLATAQESMIEVADIMEQWESSQLVLEKSTFDSMNISDKALHLSRAGNKLIARLQNCCNTMVGNSEPTDDACLAEILGETGNMLYKILEVAKASSEVAHKLEQEVAYQREITDHMKNSVNTINSSVNQAVACAEFLLAEL